MGAGWGLGGWGCRHPQEGPSACGLVILFTFPERPPVLPFAPISRSSPSPRGCRAVGTPPPGPSEASWQLQEQGHLAGLSGFCFLLLCPLHATCTPQQAPGPSAGALEGRPPAAPGGSLPCPGLQSLCQVHCAGWPLDLTMRPGPPPAPQCTPGVSPADTQLPPGSVSPRPAAPPPSRVPSTPQCQCPRCTPLPPRAGDRTATPLPASAPGCAEAWGALPFQRGTRLAASPRCAAGDPPRPLQPGHSRGGEDARPGRGPSPSPALGVSTASRESVTSVPLGRHPARSSCWQVATFWGLAWGGGPAT